MKKVLVLSGTASAMNYVLSLAGNSYELHVTDSDLYCPGLYMPNIVPHVVPRARSRDAYRAAIDRIVKEERIDFVIPTSDYDVEAIAAYVRDGWTPDARLFRPPWDAFQILRDKRKLMAHMLQRIPEIVPRTWPTDLEPDTIVFPAVVKPVAESGGKGVCIVRNSGELRAAVARARSGFSGDLVVQQYIPGSTWVTTLVYDHEGRARIAVSMRSHLTFFTWGGGGCAGQTERAPDLIALSERLIEACGGWRGPINVEWRRSDEGRWYLLEANCRLNGYSYLTTMNGLSLPQVVTDLLEGRNPTEPYADPYQGRNFNIGYRELNVERWIS